MTNSTKSQEILLSITKIIETECVKDADELLTDGFVLLAVNKSIFEDSENRFVYALGYPRPLAELPDWVKSNY